MDYKAIHRYADTGPRKIRLFADLIRGRNVDEALQLLRFYHNRGARLMEEVVRSALGNADHLECPDLDSLVVSEARVDGAPTFKRMQPRARGTAFMIKRRLAHIHVTLSEPPDETAESPTLPLPPPGAPATAGAPRLPAAPPATN
ncbi:MAG TPA: 50S ribosomal protein L22 [Urbifossiella sp.]|nr:50S ribosomal protein L22 [Urbifossiella sp.]